MTERGDKPLRYNGVLPTPANCLSCKVSPYGIEPLSPLRHRGYSPAQNPLWSDDMFSNCKSGVWESSPVYRLIRTTLKPSRTLLLLSSQNVLYTKSRKCQAVFGGFLEIFREAEGKGIEPSSQLNDYCFPDSCNKPIVTYLPACRLHSRHHPGL